MANQEHQQDAVPEQVTEEESTAGPRTPEEKQAFDELVTRIYAKLKPLAARVRWGSNETMSPTVLLHEAYLRLLNSKGLATRPHEEVIGIFVTVMKQIMVDQARRKKTRKRGSGGVISLTSRDEPDSHVTLSKEPVAMEDILTLEAGIEEMRANSPRRADIIERRFYLGLTAEETAISLRVSKTTVEREDREARNFLNARIGPRHS